MPEQKRKIIEVDVCGQLCPSTLLISLKEVNMLKQSLLNGETQLDILTDNHDSTNRVCEAIGNMGYQVDVEDRKNFFRIIITKAD